MALSSTGMTNVFLDVISNLLLPS